MTRSRRARRHGSENRPPATGGCRIDALPGEKLRLAHGSHPIALEGDRDKLRIEMLAIADPYIDPVAKEIDRILLQPQVHPHVGMSLQKLGQTAVQPAHAQ